MKRIGKKVSVIVNPFKFTHEMELGSEIQRDVPRKETMEKQLIKNTAYNGMLGVNRKLK